MITIFYFLSDQLYFVALMPTFSKLQQDKKSLVSARGYVRIFCNFLRRFTIFAIVSWSLYSKIYAASYLLDVSLLSFFSPSATSSRELSDWNSLSLSKESENFSDPVSVYFISAAFFSFSTYSLSCLKIAKAFWAFCESTGSSSYTQILDTFGDTVVERSGVLVGSSMLTRRDTFGSTLPMPSWSVEGGLLSSDSLYSSKIGLFCRFDLKGLNAFY